MPARAPIVRVVSNFVGCVALGALLVVAGGCSKRPGGQPAGSSAATSAPTPTSTPTATAKTDPAVYDRARASVALIDESAAARRQVFANLPDDPKQSAAALNSHMDATVARYEKLAAMNQGLLRKNFEVMAAHLKAASVVSTEFQQANLGLTTDEFLDFEKITPTALASWIAVVERYNKAVRAYQEFAANPPLLIAHHEAAKREGGEAETYARDLLETNNTETKSLIALMALRLEFGRAMLSMLKYLQTHAGEYAVGNDAFTFKDSARQAEFDKLLREFGKQGQAAAKAEEEFEEEMKRK